VISAYLFNEGRINEGILAFSLFLGAVLAMKIPREDPSKNLGMALLLFEQHCFTIRPKKRRALLFKAASALLKEAKVIKPRNIELLNIVGGHLGNRPSAALGILALEFYRDNTKFSWLTRWKVVALIRAVKARYSPKDERIEMWLIPVVGGLVLGLLGGFVIGQFSLGPFAIVGGGIVAVVSLNIFGWKNMCRRYNGRRTVKEYLRIMRLPNLILLAVLIVNTALAFSH
jgi:hypothetical protein